MAGRRRRDKMEFKTNQNHFFLDYEYYLVAKKMLKVKDGKIFSVVSGQPLWHGRLDNELFTKKPLTTPSTRG
jgi:hypothetical protein